MATTEERVRKLVDENLEVDGRTVGQALDLNSSLRDSGVSSLDIVAFGKIVAQDFGVTMTPDDCATINTIGALIDFLDSRSG